MPSIIWDIDFTLTQGMGSPELFRMGTWASITHPTAKLVGKFLNVWHAGFDIINAIPDPTALSWLHRFHLAGFDNWLVSSRDKKRSVETEHWLQRQGVWDDCALLALCPPGVSVVEHKRGYVERPEAVLYLDDDLPLMRKVLEDLPQPPAALHVGDWRIMEGVLTHFLTCPTLWR